VRKKLDEVYDLEAKCKDSAMQVELMEEKVDMEKDRCAKAKALGLIAFFTAATAAMRRRGGRPVSACPCGHRRRWRRRVTVPSYLLAPSSPPPLPCRVVLRFLR
jgi:hypothetical protein